VIGCFCGGDEPSGYITTYKFLYVWVPSMWSGITSGTLPAGSYPARHFRPDWSDAMKLLHLG